MKCLCKKEMDEINENVLLCYACGHIYRIDMQLHYLITNSPISQQYTEDEWQRVLKLKAFL
jgi:hypothetical protein